MSDTVKKAWGRHRKLLEDPNVKRWCDNTARGSVATAEVRLRRLGVYCERTNTTPRDFAQAGVDDVRKVEDMLMDYVSLLEGKKYAPSYIEDILKALRSWLAFNYVKLVRRIKIKNADIPVTLEDEEIPTREKIQDVLDSAPARERVSISMMAFAGVRPQVLGNHHGEDGLRIRDIPDLEVDGENISFARMPARITVRPALSKAGHQYFTFLPEAGCRYLQGYLMERIAGGEKIEPDSPVITFVKGYRTKSDGDTSHLRTVTVTEGIRNAFGIIIKERPYVLRAYFDTQLLLAESKGAMTHAYRQFFMGHKGDIEAKYTTNKHRLADELVSDMRDAYGRSLAFLVPGAEEKAGSMDRKEMLLEMWRGQARLYGIDPVKIRIERQRVPQGKKTGQAGAEDDEISAIREAIQRIITGDGRMVRPQAGGKKAYESRLAGFADPYEAGPLPRREGAYTVSVTELGVPKSITVTLYDIHGVPMRNRLARAYIDDVLQASITTDADGTMGMTFVPRSEGQKSLRIEVDGQDRPAVDAVLDVRRSR